MRKIFIFSILALFLYGCIAFVDRSSDERQVKSFLITKDETLNIVDQADEKSPDEKREYKVYKLFEKKPQE